MNQQKHFDKPIITEVHKFLTLLSNNIGQTLTGYHWREICGLLKELEAEFESTFREEFFYNGKDKAMLGDLVEVTADYDTWKEGERLIVAQIIPQSNGNGWLYNTSGRCHIDVNRVKLIQRQT